jgi:hypothetical protein
MTCTLNITTPNQQMMNEPGYAVALWLSTNPDIQRASTILVHTRNADGAMRMVEELRKAGRSAEYVPFPFWLSESNLTGSAKPTAS